MAMAVHGVRRAETPIVGRWQRGGFAQVYPVGVLAHSCVLCLSCPVPEDFEGEANASSYFGVMALLACLVR